MPPAELESLLLQHPDIADAGVVGIDSHAEATELPRYVFLTSVNLHNIYLLAICNSAYVVHAKGLSSEEEKKVFGKSVQKWIEGRVAKHKYLRGGVIITDVIPKRCVIFIRVSLSTLNDIALNAALPERFSDVI